MAPNMNLIQRIFPQVQWLRFLREKVLLLLKKMESQIQAKGDSEGDFSENKFMQDEFECRSVFSNELSCHLYP